MPTPIDISTLSDDKLQSLHEMLEQAMHPTCEECEPPWEVQVQYDKVRVELSSRNLI